MSELREECYKCLNNQTCPSCADYGSIICMIKRKYEMPKYREDSVYATRFAVMQQQINEKDKRIKELEEENRTQRKQIMSAYDRGWIPKQKVKDILKELNQEYIKIDKSIDIYKRSDDRGKVDCLQMIGWLEGKLEELLEDK